MLLKRILCVAILSLTFFAASANAYEKRDYLQKKSEGIDIAQTILPRDKWIPYPDYSDRKGWNKYLGKKLSEKFTKNGERYLKYQWKVIKASDYLEFGRSGDRKVLEAPYGENRKALTALTMAELAEGKGRFIDQIANGAIAMCEMTSWSPAAHIGEQKSRGVFPDFNEDIIEIVGSDTAALMAWNYYFFKKEFDKLSPLISKRIYHELDKRILSNFVKKVKWWWVADDYKGGLVNNWNPWCNSNVLLCYLLVDDNPQRRAAGVSKTMKSVDKFLNYVKADGACEEGPAYWGAAAGALFKYLYWLDRATGSKISIFDNPQVREMGEYIAYAYIGDGWVVNFADAGAKSLGGDPHFIFAYGAAIESDVMKGFAKRLDTERGGSDVSTDSLTRLAAQIATRGSFNISRSEFKYPKAKWYPQTQFLNMLDSERSLFCAAKAGFNDESHNHNDVGSFILYYKNKPLLIDAGVGTYSRKTFSRERYQIWSMRSGWHSLPEINGCEQKEGAKYKAKDVTFDEKTMTFSADIAGAYPKDADVKKWTRTLTFADGKLTLRDVWELASVKGETRVNFLCAVKPVIGENGSFVLTNKDASIEGKFDATLADAKIEEQKVDDKPLKKMWGESVYKLSIVPKKQTQTGELLVEFTAK